MYQQIVAWIVSAGTPAVAVIGFFWKGDDALSTEFKQWLSQKILSAKLVVPGIKTIAPLGSVFGLVYGSRYVGLNALARVFTISIIAFSVSAVAIFQGSMTGIFDFLSNAVTGFGVGTLLVLLAINVVFDFISVGKSRLLIDRFSKRAGGATSTLMLLSDLILTALLVIVYYVVTIIVVEIMRELDFNHADFGHVGGGATFGRNVYEVDEYGVLTELAHIPVVITMSLPLVLALLYLLSIQALRNFGYASRAVDIMKWMLPISVLPIRSIGIMAGLLVFLCFSAYNALVSL